MQRGAAKVGEPLELAQTAGGDGVVVTQAGSEGRGEAGTDLRRDERLGGGALIGPIGSVSS